MKKGSVSIFLGLMLLAAALGLTGYNLFDSYRASASVHAVLEKLTPQMAVSAAAEPEAQPEHGAASASQDDPQDSSETEYADYLLNPHMAMPEATVDELDYIGVLSVPRLGMEVPVLSKWSYRNLKVTACRYSGSAYLDNLVLCGHNYMGLFGQIRTLNLGDEVRFTDMDGNQFLYEVTEVETVTPNAVRQMTTGGWDLTLFTCTAGAQARIAVRCERVEE